MSGIERTSLFWTMIPKRGSNTSAAAMRPTSKMKLLNCRARATRLSAGPGCPENWCEIHACR